MKTKKITALLLCVIMIMSLVACSTDAQNEPHPTDGPAGSTEKLYTPGVYRDEANGKNGNIRVQVEFDENEILKVEILEHYETTGYGDKAIEQLPIMIVESQSTEVDTISGATYTSDAIKKAVQASIEQAKGAISETETSFVDEVIDTDVVIVGSGIAGTTAAVAAAREGAKVIVLEKRDTVGTAGHGIMAAGTTYQEIREVEDTPEELAEYWLQVGEGKLDEEMIKFAANESANTIDWLSENGVDFVGVTIPLTNPFTRMRNHVTTSDRNGQEGYVKPLAEQAESLGAKFLFEHHVKSLIQNEDGTITGVVAENNGRTVTVNAKSVILATGGYANNGQLMRQYAPLTEWADTSMGAAQGEGLIMARNAGAEIVAPGGSLVTAINNDGAPHDRYGEQLMIDPSGNRFINENDYILHRTRVLNELGYSHHYTIFDADDANSEDFKRAIENGSAWTADTIEELSAKVGINAETLTNTVNRYNEMAANGLDTDFGKPASRVGLVFDPERENPEDIDLIEKEFILLDPIVEGPYYISRSDLSSFGLPGTIGGPKTDINTHVINTSGEIIPGLFAVGEVANGQIFNKDYPLAGTALSFYTTYGRIGGAVAAREAITK